MHKVKRVRLRASPLGCVSLRQFRDNSASVKLRHWFANDRRVLECQAWSVGVGRPVRVEGSTSSVCGHSCLLALHRFHLRGRLRTIPHRQRDSHATK